MEEQELDFVPENMKKKSIVIDDEIIVALLEYAKEKMIISVRSRDLIILHDWKVVKQIIEPVFSNTLKYWIEPMPGFSEEQFPFLVCSGW